MDLKEKCETMINLKKGHYVPVPAAQKQEWIREMWEDMKDKPDPCKQSMQSGSQNSWSLFFGAGKNFLGHGRMENE
jgi:hypothetical protein